jgi:Fe-S cluster biosynthesis and repair protein YggX
MALVCARCGREGEPPVKSRIGFPRELKERILSSVCADCWKEWEGLEVKVINEYRLNFMDPQHREALARTCTDFLFGNTAETPAT